MTAKKHTRHPRRRKKAYHTVILAEGMIAANAAEEKKRPTPSSSPAGGKKSPRAPIDWRERSEPEGRVSGMIRAKNPAAPEQVLMSRKA